MNAYRSMDAKAKQQDKYDEAMEELKREQKRLSDKLRSESKDKSKSAPKQRKDGLGALLNRFSAKHPVMRRNK